MNPNSSPGFARHPRQHAPSRDAAGTTSLRAVGEPCCMDVLLPPARFTPSGMVFFPKRSGREEGTGTAVGDHAREK